MNKSLFSRYTLILFTSLLLSCSGGETGTGIKQVVSLGAITGFGSVYVNGTRYDTTDTSFSVNGQNAEENQLSLGMVVAVSGSKSGATSGSATQLSYDSEFKGVVSSHVNGQMQVMGQTVYYDVNTHFGNSVTAWTSPQEILIDTVVEISGYRRADSSLQATYIKVISETLQAGEELLLTGQIAGLTDNTFMIGTLEIGYDSATAIQDGPLSEGQSVKVKSDRGFNGNQWLAGNIENAHSFSWSEGTTFELEGMIGSHDPLNRIFSLAGQIIHYDDMTQFQTGDANLLLQNAKLEVEGYVRADGSLFAEEIEYKLEVTVIISARLDAVDTMNSELTILGQTIRLDQLQVLKDDSDQSVEDFTLTDLLAGDLVEIKAFLDATGQLSAVEIKRLQFQSAQTNVKLKAELQDITPDNEAVMANVTVIDADPDEAFSASDIGNILSIESATYNNTSGKLTATKFSI